METTKNSRKPKSPSSKKFGLQLDFITRLDRSEKIFQARMLEIFQKYDHPFVNDIVINIEDLTYETPDGRRPWTFETDMVENGKSEDTVREELTSETEDSKETELTLSKKTLSVRKRQDLRPRKQFFCGSPEANSSHCSTKKKLFTTFEIPGQTCTTLMQYEEENSYADDYKRIVSTQNTDLSVIKKTIHVALPLKATVSEQVKRFIDMNNKACFLKYPQRYNVAVCQADDSGPADKEEASYSEPGNKTLADFYPQMLENFCRVWSFNMKNQAADNIVRYYKRHIWCKNKKVTGMKMINRKMSKSINKTYTICPAPNVKEVSTAPKTCVSTLLQEKCLHKSGLREPIKIQSLSLFSQVHKLDSPVLPLTNHFGSQSIVNKTFECVKDKRTILMDCPFPVQHQKEKYGVMPTGYSSRASSSSCTMSISSSKGIISKCQMDTEIVQFPYCKDSKYRQQDIRTLSRSNSLSGFLLLQSPKKVVAKPNYNMREGTKSLSKAMTTETQMEVDERNHASYKEHIKQLPNRTCSLTRRNSFSAFPVAHSANRDFEGLYRNLTQARPQPDFSLGKAQVQLSKTVSSLVNSPGSLRSKRPLSHDISFSMSKKPRRVTEALIGSLKLSSHSMDSSEPICSKSSSSLTLHHSVVASALPTYMLPHSPMSSRPLSPGVNGGSPKRTNARIYRKLTYQEDSGTISGN